ncbi:hypothetical protein AVEN_210299-1 [Araneus ventricosus]|uniref:Uncharacterized protein n=1 Tax=Araneus ventricosus TaxID=182803 RepID=A0A4Y1ZJS4_ARAVE|nr:hypothetical protein AVEN_210299-1 [Araneus ventricosus]
MHRGCHLIGLNLLLSRLTVSNNMIFPYPVLSHPLDENSFPHNRYLPCGTSTMRHEHISALKFIDIETSRLGKSGSNVIVGCIFLHDPGVRHPVDIA